MNIQSERWFFALMVMLLLCIAALAGCASTQEDIGEARVILNGIGDDSRLILDTSTLITGDENKPHVETIQAAATRQIGGVEHGAKLLDRATDGVAKMQDDLDGWLTPKAKSALWLGGIIAVAGIIGYFVLTKSSVFTIGAAVWGWFTRKSA